MTIKKDVAIAYLKEINKGKEAHEITTRLYYGNEGKYVQDFSYFTNENYMSQDLLEAFRTGQTLTSELEEELLQYIHKSTI